MSQERPRRRGKRTRYIVSIRMMALIVFTTTLGGFVLGYGLAFLMWWNR